MYELAADRGSLARGGLAPREPGSRSCRLARSHRLASGSFLRERRSRTRRNLPESVLHTAWRRTGAASGSIAGRDGHRYRVIYPGRPADGAGPDFRDAILLRDDGKRIHGHVELHVRSGDWKLHGHAEDRAYNGVVLHVVGEESGAAAEAPAGLRIPLLVLRRFEVQASDGPDPGLSRMDRGDAISAGHTASALPLPMLDMDAAGDLWFAGRSHAFSLEIASRGADQALWAGALECLGYPANKKGFRQLADRLDWQLAARLLESHGEPGLIDVLLWAGGFSERPAQAPLLSGRRPEWRARYGRPANDPRRRIPAAAAWASCWSAPGGPAESFVEVVRATSRPADLAQLFMVSSDSPRSAPVGRSRARDIVVNLLLTAVHAIANARGDASLARRAKRLFDAHPLLSMNSITREASLILKSRGLDGAPRTARQQQGLIHIYRISVASQRSEDQLPLL